eukprot:7813973-Ditylum_brightwellii.AAC.1
MLHPFDILQYNGGVAFPSPVCIDYREGTFLPCILDVLDEQSKSDKQHESPYFHVTYHLYVGARQAKQG